MGFPGGLLNGDHLHAGLGGALRQRPQDALAVALLVVVLSSHSLQVVDLQGLFKVTIGRFAAVADYFAQPST